MTKKAKAQTPGLVLQAVRQYRAAVEAEAALRLRFERAEGAHYATPGSDFPHDARSAWVKVHEHLGVARTRLFQALERHDASHRQTPRA